jgi:ElaB/YqjD/DUF883 family membrane-anchored ribosome-binding protein
MPPIVRRRVVVGGIEERIMANPTAQNFDRAFQDAKRQAAHVTDAASTAVRKTTGSFERAVRGIVENQPYTAVGIALAIGWFFGRMHRPL